MFALRRPDVLSTSDIGIQRGMAHWTGNYTTASTKKSGKFKYMKEKDMLALSQPWAPYRSIAAWYMWRVDAQIAHSQLNTHTKLKNISKSKNSHIVPSTVQTASIGADTGLA